MDLQVVFNIFPMDMLIFPIALILQANLPDKSNNFYYSGANVKAIK